jgi:hypothetical protein
MGYNKFIKCGNSFELYEYEKNLPFRVKRNKIPKSKSLSLDLAFGGKNPLPKRQLGKRRDNAKRAQMAFRRLILCQLGGATNPLLFTITYAENQCELSTAYADFRSYIQALRYKFGEVFKYIAVPEFQKRGAVHFHALFWGLPSELYNQERTTRELANLWGRGFIYLKETDGSDKLSSYLAKYMVKSFLDERLCNQKAYTSSRNCVRPLVGSDFSPVWPIVDDYVGVDNPPLLEKEYMTQWLGKGRYRLFKI